MQRILFFFVGITSTIWFLVRVIPKPVRATYPCMRAAAPLMSSFVCYLLTFFGAATTFRLFRKNLRKARWVAAGLSGALFILLLFLVNAQDVRNTFAATVLSNDDLNAYHNSSVDGSAIGVPQGIIPGRVVWAWDNRATDERANEKEQAVEGMFYFQEAMNDQFVIDRLFDASVMSVVGLEKDGSLVEAWNKIFLHFNNLRAQRFGESEREGKTYQPGEKIFIKMNYTSQDGPNTGGEYKNTDAYGGSLIESSPFVLLALLRNLVEYVGVAQEDIYIGDPIRNFPRNDLEYIFERYPQVNLLGKEDKYGKTLRENGTEDRVFYADLGGHIEKLNKQLDDATYLFNLPVIKGHASAGYSAAVKNFLGAHTLANSQHLHVTFLDDEENRRYDIYRAHLDLMASKHLGQKTVLHIADALYSGDRWDGRNVKWEMPPFNNDYPSSLFMSLDPVALESVCYDFIRGEYRGQDGAYKEAFPHMVGADDFLHQAADPDCRPYNWKNGKNYNPDGNRPVTFSLGVHEHWDPETKSYKTIDLVKLKSAQLKNNDYRWKDLDAILKYPNRESVLVVPHTEALQMDGDYEKSPWINLPWLSSNFCWLSTSGITQEYPALFKEYDLNPQNYSGFYKLAWNKDNKELYILFKVKDSSFIEDNTTDESWKDAYWEKYDILEIFFAPDATEGWHGNISNNDDGIALHTTVGFRDDASDSWRVRRSIDVDPSGAVADYTHYIKDSYVKKIGDYYYWEIALDISRVPKEKLCHDGEVKFCMTYNDVDDVNGSVRRTGQYGTIYQPDGKDWNDQECRNNAWQIIDALGTLRFSENGPTGIESVDEIEKIGKIYIAGESLYIENMENGSRISIYDYRGQLLYSDILKTENEQISLTDISASNFIVVCQSSTKKVSKKFVVNR
ncbi:MAG: DUF362 domain-containing protein [Bacteroidales bacterium]|nr:DUF362 domain-containing protein [Bacteroidales bacterium]